MNLKTFFKSPITDICLAIQAALMAIAIARTEPEGIIVTVFGLAIIAYLRLVDMRMASADDETAKRYRAWVEAIDRALKDELKNFKTTVTK